MAEITLPDIAEAVAKQIPALFNDAIDQLRDGEGAYLRDGMPEGAVARVGQAVGRAACRRFGANPVGATLVNSERFERACRPYLDSITPGNGLGTALPFTGGQCQGLTYRAVGQLQWDIFIGNTGQTISNSEEAATEFIFVGPVTGQRPIYSNPGSVGPRDFIIEFQTGAGPITAFFRTNPISTNSVSNARFTGTFELADGTDGGCGFPPPVIVQPRPQPDPIEPPFRFNPVPGIDIGVDVTINPDGTISFDLGDGPTSVDPFAEDDDNSGIITGPPPGDQGQPGGAGDTGAGGDTDGDAPAGQILVGLKMDLLNTPPDRYLVAPGVYRGGAYIYMGGDIALDQDFAGSLLMSGQFVFAEKENLTKWRVKSNTGFNWRVTPYYREAT